MAGLYTNRIQAPTKELRSDWIPEDGELFRDASGALYMGDNVTPSDQLDPIGGVGSVAGATCGLPYTYDNASPSDVGNAGTIRMNSTTAASVTTVTLGGSDLNNEDQENYLDLFTSGLMKIYHGDGLCLVFKVTRMINKLNTDNYFDFTVQHVSGAMPTNLSTVRMDAVMDAPGVRKLTFAYTPSAENLEDVSYNSFTGDPSISFDTDHIVVTLAGEFGSIPARINGYGSFGSNDDASRVPACVVYEDQDTVHVHWTTQTNLPGSGVVTIIIED